MMQWPKTVAFIQLSNRTRMVCGSKENSWVKNNIGSIVKNMTTADNEYNEIGKIVKFSLFFVYVTYN